MKLTVGPLPAAVYWRRRAVVLGGVLLLVVLIGYSCGGDSGAHPTGDSTAPSPTRWLYPSEEPSEQPTGGDSGGSGGPTGAGESPSVAGPGPDPGADSGGQVPDCADEDLSIAPKPVRTRTPEGARLRVDLVITNISDRPCKRDIGADRQEIRVMRGKQRVWSSDDCNPQRGSVVEVLSPDRPIERFWVTWDGRTSAPKCEGERAVAQEGDYSVLARLGRVVSEPVPLKVVDTS